MSSLPPNPTGLTVLDPDVAGLLPATATVTERIYAVAVQDTRDANEMRLQSDIDRAAASLAETKRHNQVCEKIAADQLATIRESDAGFDRADSLFISCVKLGVETRKQTMSSSTGRDTVMADVVRDGTWIGYQVYNLLAAELGLEPRLVPATL